MSQTISTFDPALKDHYVGTTAADLTDIAGPALASVRRNTKAGGKDGRIVQPVKFQRAAGGSATFAKALANAVASKYDDFNLTRKKNYQFAYIDNEVIEASMGDENAFAQAMDEIDDAFKNCGERLARMLPRSGGGAIGRIQSGTTLAAAVATLDDPADVFNFEVGSKYTFAAANGTGSERDSAATLTCTGIARESSTVTFGANLSTISGIADTDYIFQEGDFGACHSGTEDWFPIDRTGLGTAFNGVTRSQDADRLGGLYRIANGEGLDETLVKGLGTLGKHGAKSGLRAWCNPEKESDLMLLLEGKVYMSRTEIKGRGTVGFSAVEALCGSQKVILAGDLHWPTNRMYIGDWTSMWFHSAGESPKFLDRDGLLSRASATDSYECRVGGYGQFGNERPGHNMNCDLS